MQAVSLNPTLLIRCVFNVQHVLVPDTNTYGYNYVRLINFLKFISVDVLVSLLIIMSVSVLLLHNSFRNSLSNLSNFKLFNCFPRHVIYGTSQLLVVT